MLVLGESERTDRVDSTGAIGIELVKHFLQIRYRKAKVACLRAPTEQEEDRGEAERRMKRVVDRVRSMRV